MKGMSPMTTNVAIEATPMHRKSVWERISTRLQSWGRAIKRGLTWLKDKVVRGFKWFVHLTPVRWTITKTKTAAAFLWHYAKGPVGAVVATLAAIFFAPKAVAVMLALVVVCLVVVGFFAYKTWRELKNKAPEEVQEFVDHINASVHERGDGKLRILDEGELNPLETFQERWEFLENVMDQAEAEKDDDLFSEAVARIHVVEIRGNLISHNVPRKASSPDLYKRAREKAELLHPNFPWNWNVMNRAVANEDKRIRELTELKRHVGKSAEQMAGAAH